MTEKQVCVHCETVNEPTATQCSKCERPDLVPESRYDFKTHQPKQEEKEGVRLNAGGGFVPELNLRYEPLGNCEYVFNLGGLKGITKAEQIFEERGKKRVPAGWQIVFVNKRLTFKNPPLDQVLFKIPPREKLLAWVDGELAAPTGAEIFKRMSNFFRVFLDVPFKEDYTVFNLLSLQTWLRDFVNNWVFGSLQGQFGGGKTSALENMEYASYHATLTSSITGAGMARIIEAQRLTLLHDELDEEVKGSEAGNSKLALMRQGQRRGQKHIRYRQEGGGWDISEPFAAQFFTEHSEIERALGMRCLKVLIRRSKDHRLPINNIFRASYGNPLLADLFLWSMTEPLKPEFKQRTPEFSRVELEKALPTLQGLPEDEQRQKIYELATQHLPNDWKEWLAKQSGRTAELGYCAAFVGLAFNISSELLADVKANFSRKEEREEANESTLLAFVREALVEALEAEERRDDVLKTSDGLLFTRYTTFYENLKGKTVAAGWDKTPSNQTLTSQLQEVGFVEGDNKKRCKIPHSRLTEAEQGKYPQGRSVECLIFDKNVRGYLCPPEVNQGNSVNLDAGQTTLATENPQKVNPVPQVHSVHAVPQVTRVTLVKEVTGKLASITEVKP